MRAATTAYCVLLSIAAAQAVDIYLAPAPTLRTAATTALSPEAAAAAISRHLGLEAHEPLDGAADVFADLFAEQPFVAQGQKDGLVLTMNEDDAKDILPSSLHPTAFLDAPEITSLDTFTNAYVHKAAHTYDHIWSGASVPAERTPRLLDIFSIPSASGDAFLAELSTLADFLDADAPTERASKFAALELRGLQLLADEHGRTSEAYRTGAAALRATLQSAFTRANLNIALLTFPPAGTAAAKARRAPQQSPLPPQPQHPQESIDSTARCFASADACANATGACSGHGQCVAGSRAGRTCFVCACGATKDAKGRTTHWAGQTCERQDVSGPFVLLTGTVIALLVFVGGSVSLLYSIGSQDLPNVLTGGVGGTKKD